MMAMRFKKFIWPNNPARCSYQVRRNTAIHKYPGGGYSVEDLGEARRILTGSGEFYGENAYETMLELLRVYEQPDAGVLVHPILQFQQAYFTELSLIQEPRKDYVAYQFTFVEDILNGGAEMEPEVPGGSYYTVQEGQTLWDISRLCGVTVIDMMEMNPWIFNPNTLKAGERVRLA